MNTTEGPLRMPVIHKRFKVRGDRTSSNTTSIARAELNPNRVETMCQGGVCTVDWKPKRQIA